MKNWLRISIVGLIAIFITILFSSLAAYKTERDKRISYENLYRSSDQKVKIYQDSEKAWHTRSDVYEVKSIEALRLVAKYDPVLANLDKRFESVNKNLKNIQYLGISSMSSSYPIDRPGSTDTLVIFNKDTIQAKAIIQTDSLRWYTFKALVYNNTIQHIDFQAHDSLETVITFKRKWLLGRKRYFQEIKSLNPHSKVNYARSIKIGK
jgi:hypothetical protein